MVFVCLWLELGLSCPIQHFDPLSRAHFPLSLVLVSSSLLLPIRRQDRQDTSYPSFDVLILFGRAPIALRRRCPVRYATLEDQPLGLFRVANVTRSNHLDHFFARALQLLRLNPRVLIGVLRLKLLAEATDSSA